MTSSAILRALRQLAGLPLRPETVCHLLFNSEAIQPSINRLIAADPALALGLLRTVPPPLSEQKIGVPQIARAATPAVLLGLAKSNCRGGNDSKFRTTPILDRLWTHSIATAYAARQLSRARSYSHPNAAFLAGLLHNMGLLALAVVAPGIVEEVFDRTSAADELLVVEQNRLGRTHTSIGRQLAQRWSLPRWLHDVTWWHHQPEDGLPGSIGDRELVLLVQEADRMATCWGFGLIRGSSAPPSVGPPWKADDPAAAALLREVRLTSAFMSSQPLRDELCDESPGETGGLISRMLELATENVTLHTRTDWRMAAWEKLASLAPDASLAELTGVVAATLADATGALGVLCYVRSEDGTAAEGTLWTDDACSVSCPLVAGSGAQPHATQVVTRLRPTWQKRSYRVIDLGTEGENLAHVLLWLDDLSASDEKLIQEVSTWCGFWLERVAHVARLEQQLENLAAALREQSARTEVKLEEAKLAALAEMAAGAGHEINNPLAVISGRAQLLLAEESDPRRRKALETINAQAQRIHRMIVDLMTFARPPAPICQPLTIAEVVAQALGRVKADADSRRVTITTTVNPALPQVSGDMGQLATVLECVLQNGLEAIVEDGAVEVVADSGADSTVELRISDNGPGISESQRAHVFEPFYSGREAGRGLGMGLSKAWRFVRNHKGEIQVGSSPEGTTIIVRLPALAAATEQRACA